MPIYEYQCRKCGRKEEVFFTSMPKDEEASEQDCKGCGSRAVKIPSGCDFHLKGDWFKTKGRY